VPAAATGRAPAGAAGSRLLAERLAMRERVEARLPPIDPSEGLRP
jgi:hypothetical protein